MTPKTAGLVRHTRPGRIRPRAPMTSRSATLRWMTWACAWALVLPVSRTAGAAAPFSAERGASAIAPPPIRMLGDDKIDAAFPIGWEAPLPVRAAFGPRSGGHSQPVVADAGFDDTWVKPNVPRLPTLTPVHARGASTTSLPASAGYGRDVF